MKNNKSESPAQNWVETLDGKDYQELIGWAKREIKEYQVLIKILEKKLKK